MPLYCFTIPIDDQTPHDPAFRSLRDADAAYDEAKRLAQDIWAASGDRRLMRAVVVVTDADGEIVLEFPFTEAITAP
ncbi:DUF6894 family protein [Methylobacterium gossipiicola]|uniref:DUF6894 domain-containing protein n=1 Tax=Methylobacterium gossipiicola TaxID=582675 RepID=A0A1I2UED4_9HYPH|nr:hypothetical protein [Methylobacterium gossipiicola]SFG75542.1 hypothetical protein SAMN05192565_11025 [Methylobacterium gossipiicola]